MTKNKSVYDKERVQLDYKVKLNADTDGVPQVYENQAVIEGYALVWNTPIDRGFYTMTMKPESVAKTLSKQPTLNGYYNHDGFPISTTKNGTLTVEADEYGLKQRQIVNRDISFVNDIVTLMEDGNLTEASAAFIVEDDEWLELDDGKEMRVIKEINLSRGDVSVVDFGANPLATSRLVTSLSAESLDEVLANTNPEVVAILREKLKSDTATDAVEEPPTDGVEAEEEDAALEAVRAQTRLRLRMLGGSNA